MRQDLKEGLVTFQSSLTRIPDDPVLAKGVREDERWRVLDFLRVALDSSIRKCDWAKERGRRANRKTW